MKFHEMISLFCETTTFLFVSFSYVSPSLSPVHCKEGKIFLLPHTSRYYVKIAPPVAIIWQINVRLFDQQQKTRDAVGACIPESI
jgi:hypothetical protein